MVYTYAQYIVTFFQIRGHIVKERDITIGAFTKQVAVQINFTTVVYSFEVNVMACGIVGDVEMLAIPAYSTRQVARTTGQ